MENDGSEIFMMGCVFQPTAHALGAKKGPGESPGPIKLTSGLVRGENYPTRNTFISAFVTALFLSVSAVAKAALDHFAFAAGSFGAAASPDAA